MSMEFKSKKMKGTTRCNVVREHYKLQEERSKDAVFDEVVAKKEAIKEGLRYKAKLRNEKKPYTSKEKELLNQKHIAPKSTDYKCIDSITAGNQGSKPCKP